jgi:flagellar motility protein MotE (MotC chaperone)
LLILGLLIKMDVGGFGSTVLYPVLKDVPVVNKILPESEDYAQVDEAYAYDSVEDAVERIKELEQQLADAKTSSDDSNAYIAELEAQAAELKTYKENEAAFEEEKEKFYNEVVFSDEAPDISSYKEYYESIDPENAEAIYKQVVQQEQEDEEITEYAATYSNMKASQAAAIFNTMGDNLPLVGKILWSMDAQSRANILGAMDTDIAAAVTKLMEP